MDYEHPNHEIVENKKAIRTELQKQVDEYLRSGGQITIAKRISKVADLPNLSTQIWNTKIAHIERSERK